MILGDKKTMREESAQQVKRLVNHAMTMGNPVHVSVTIQANASRLYDQTQCLDR